uniref:Uncharacterized protein n=1 Tax=Arundo donax TaxID=35708 RepID=A0A0A9A1C5_ARUDO
MLLQIMPKINTYCLMLQHIDP